MPPSSDQDERRFGPTRQPAEVSRSTPALDITLTTDWVSPSLARDRVRTWLTNHHWSPAHTDDLVLAVNEAVTNSIEHGYGISPEEAVTGPALPHATIEVHGEIALDEQGRRYAEFVIRDRGGWRTPTSDATRGNGIRLMQACTADFAIHHGITGTTVRFRSHPLPGLPHQGPMGPADDNGVG